MQKLGEMMRKIATLIISIVVSVLLHGCATTAVGGTAAGVAVVHDRRTAGTVVDDEVIELKIFAAIRRDQELSKQVHVNVTSYNGAALLTGEAPSAALRAEVGRITAQTQKVREVHNEITIAAPSSMLVRSSDSVITSKIKTRMLAEKNFDPLRIKVVTENGIVYLMGIVTPREADIATAISRRTGGVQRVVKLFEEYEPPRSTR